MRLDQMYQEIILDHYKHPHGRGLRDPFDAEVHHVNPTCGDEVTLRVHVADGAIADIGWEGEGCSISQASTSVMSDLVIGKPIEEAIALQQKQIKAIARGLEDVNNQLEASKPARQVVANGQ